MPTCETWRSFSNPDVTERGSSYHTFIKESCDFRPGGQRLTLKQQVWSIHGANPHLRLDCLDCFQAAGSHQQIGACGQIEQGHCASAQGIFATKIEDIL